MRKLTGVLIKPLRHFDRAWKRFLLAVFRNMYKVKPLRPFVRAVHKPLYVHYRLTATVLVLVIGVGISIPVLENYYHNKRYELSVQAQALLGKANPNLTKKLTFDEQQQVYQFNKDAKKDMAAEGGNPVAKLASQVGGGGKNDTQLYSVDAPKDLSKGVTYYDNQMGLSFKVIPQFKTMAAEQKEGHLLYPLQGIDGQVAYTTDPGGLKENVLLYSSPGADFNMSYTLDLPKSLEARIIPETGEVGIYSADPSLFGNISYGSSDDQARVEAARNNSEKTFLTFKIPAPQVMAMGKTNEASIANISSKFEMNGSTLVVKTTGLDKARYPLSIDPSVTIDTNSDFQSGNIDDNNFTINSGSLSRGSITGGKMGAWSSLTSIPSQRMAHGTLTYNGYLYVVSGYSGGNQTSVYYTQLNTNGTFATPSGCGGTWCAATAMNSPAITGNSARSDAGYVAYNGYIYAIGGDASSGATNTVQYAPINADGSLGNWAQTTNLNNGGAGNIRVTAAAVAYNGYVYVLGGGTATGGGGTRQNTVLYAPINANGTLGTWNSANTFTTGRSDPAAYAYNGYMYINGGYDGTNSLGDTQYAQIKSDGTLGTWASAGSAMSTARDSHGFTVYNGYLYVMGGLTSGTKLNSTEFAPIYANGKIGAWTTSSNTFTITRSDLGVTSYNGYLYVIGGNHGANDTSCNATASDYCSDVQYAHVDPPGVTTGYTSTTPFTTARYGHASTAYNGYLYVVGGYTGSYVNDVQYALISANGTVGTWNTTNSFTTGRTRHSVVAYNGYMYILGGDDGTNLYNDVQYAPINSNGTVGTWASTNSFTTNRARFGAAAYNGFMYIFGGLDSSSNSLNDVQYASISSNGTVGTWTATNSFTTARYGHAVTVYAGYAYVIGGRDTSSYYNDVQYAPINSNGTIGTWAATNSFTTARYFHSAVVADGFMYILGGQDSTSATLNDVQYAPINSNGTVGTWNTTASFSTSRHSFTAQAYNGYLFVIGGRSAGSLNDVQYAPINNGGPGTTGTWASAGTGFTTGRDGLSTVAYNGYLYILGGFSSSALNDVQYAPINSNGTIGTWATTTSFINARTNHSAIAYKGYMYIVGGYNGSTTYYNDVQYAPINSNGTIGTWHYTHNSTDDSTTFVSGFTTARAYHAAVAYNGYLYVLGGQDSTSANYNDVQYAPINSNGTIGTWAATSSFSTPRRQHTSFAYNGNLYVLGGYDGTNLYNDVQYAPINSNGTIGTWAATSSFPTARRLFTGVAANGYAYILGGNGSASLNDVQYAPINSNGTIGTWAATSSFTTARRVHASAMYNGYIYLAGGFDGTSRYNDVQYAPINVTARRAAYSKMIKLSAEGQISSIMYVGTVPGGASNITYRVAGPSGVFGSTNSSTTVGTCTAAYVQLFANLDDTQTGTAGDLSNSTNTSLDSVTINTVLKRAPTNQRLRHGAFFNNEILQPLETTPSC